jgi:hypothetical protein
MNKEQQSIQVKLPQETVSFALRNGKIAAIQAEPVPGGGILQQPVMVLAQR